MGHPLLLKKKWRSSEGKGHPQSHRAPLHVSRHYWNGIFVYKLARSLDTWEAFQDDLREGFFRVVVKAMEAAQRLKILPQKVIWGWCLFPEDTAQACCCLHCTVPLKRPAQGIWGTRLGSSEKKKREQL